MTSLSRDGTWVMTKGDTVKYPLFINAGSELVPVRYHLSDGDVVTFAVMEPNQCYEDAVIIKTYTSESEKTEFEDIYISLEPEDTENLPCGKYYYTVKLTTNSSDDSQKVQTLIPKRFLYLED